MSNVQPKCLVVDDELLFCYYIKDILQRKDIDVMVSVYFEDALYILVENEFDLVVLDICMPEKDGIELIKEVRRRQPQLPILAVSGTEAPNKELALAAGANAFITKPFDYIDLSMKSLELIASRQA